MITDKEYSAIWYILDQIYASEMLEQLNDVGEYSYTMDEVCRCISMIRNMCG
jgi:hypothetical protein